MEMCVYPLLLAILSVAIAEATLEISLAEWEKNSEKNQKCQPCPVYLIS